ncbi:hypothetical protein ACIBCR_15495 [Micromonospora echinospora]|uniref:hypothetical protein n=1 Tax=Micromonospora echinospora TaxID=1877 RepID=UPI0037963069
MRPRILDASAIVALFDAHPPVFDLLTRSQDGDLTMVMPAAAVADANAKIRASFDSWQPVLLTAGVTITPLDSHIAIEICEMPGDLATKHVVYEARVMRAVVVTCNPGMYRGHSVPLLVV